LDNAEDAINLYRAKDVVEKGFGRLKNCLDLSRLRVHSDETMQNKVFIGFVALIVLSHIHRVMDERGKRFIVKELKAATNKHLRIIAMQEMFVSGKVWFMSGAPWLSLLEGELVAFPRGKNDDAIDAMAYILQMMVVPADPGGRRNNPNVASEQRRKKMDAWSPYTNILLRRKR
jgi:hypothetical protein